MEVSAQVLLILVMVSWMCASRLSESMKPEAHNARAVKATWVVNLTSRCGLCPHRRTKIWGASSGLDDLEFSI